MTVRLYIRRRHCHSAQIYAAKMPHRCSDSPMNSVTTACMSRTSVIFLWTAVAYPELVSGGFQNSPIWVAGEGRCQYCINTLIEKILAGGWGCSGQQKKTWIRHYVQQHQIVQTFLYRCGAQIYFEKSQRTKLSLRCSIRCRNDENELEKCDHFRH